MRPKLFHFVFALLMLGESLREARAQSYYWTTLTGTNGVLRTAGARGVAVGGAGTVYVGNVMSQIIQKLTPVGTNWVVTPVAGGAQGAPDGTNTQAGFSQPEYVAVDNANNLFVPDGDTIRKVSPIGTNWVVTTVAGTAGNPGSADGTNSDALFIEAEGGVTDAAGNLYVTDVGSVSVRRVSRIGTNWVVTTIAGSGTAGSADGTNNAAEFCDPEGLAIDHAGNLYVADRFNTSIRKVKPLGADWVVTTLAGSPQAPGSADGTNSDARFYGPEGIAVDAAGSLYVTDAYNGTIRKVTPAGTNWVVTTIGGLALNSGTNDGLGSAARFDYPAGIAVDGTGNVYVADFHNYAIRKGTPVPPAPVLSIFPLPSQVVLSWPATATGFVLEAGATLTNANSWTAITNGVTTNGATLLLTNNAGSSAAFYRLHKPGG